MAVATSSNGDRTIDLTDAFVTVMQNARRVTDPNRGPSGHGPSAHVLGSRAGGLLTAIGDMYANPFTDKWPGFDPAHIGYVFTLTIAPHQTVALMTFVVKGLSEVYDPRGGFPIPIINGIVAPKYSAPYSGADAKIPAAGSEIAAVTAVARQLVAEPDVRGLTPTAARGDRELAPRVEFAALDLLRRRKNRTADPGSADPRRGHIRGPR